MDGQLPPAMEWQKIVTLLEEIVKSRAWQPIATAPRDKEILVWDGASVYVAAHAYDDRWQPDGLPSFVPTHWMPLPPPPQKEGT